MKKIVVLALILIAAGVLYLVFRTSDTEKIYAQIQKLEQYLSKEEAQATMANITVSAKAAQECTDPVLVKLPHRQQMESMDKQTLTSQIISFRNIYQQISFIYQLPPIHFPSKDRAELQCPIQFIGKSNGQNILKHVDLTMVLMKIKGKWRISQASLQQVYQP